MHWGGQRIDLTLTEFWMVHALARFPGHVKDRESLMRDAKIVVDDSTITSHIKRIRQKFLAARSGLRLHRDRIRHGLPVELDMKLCARDRFVVLNWHKPRPAPYVHILATELAAARIRQARRSGLLADGS